MNALEIEIMEGLYYIGVNDRSTELFENMWPLPEGVAYNSYLIRDEKNCLMDTVRINKSDGFIHNLKHLLNGEKLDYLVSLHMEPDHSGAIAQVLELYPDVTIVGNKRTFNMYKDYFNMEPKNKIEVKEGDVIDLGRRKLNFHMTSMVHWPESMVAYESTDKILFSQDIFGGFGVLNGTIFDDEMNYTFYEDETRRYYSNIVGKYSKMAVKALEKLGTLDINVICPVHGFVWRTNPGKIIEEYRKWANYETEEGVVIVYGSMYGNTENMADHLARCIAEEGVKNVKVYDVSKTHASYILSDIWKYKAFVLGSCTYNNSVYPNMYNLLNILDMNKIQDHILGVFGSFGWSGGAVKELKAFAERGKYDFVEISPEAKGTMKEDQLKELEELAKEIVSRIKNSEN